MLNQSYRTDYLETPLKGRHLYLVGENPSTPQDPSCLGSFFGYKFCFPDGTSI